MSQNFFSKMFFQIFWNLHRVSVQGVKSLGGHFACSCQGFDFYEIKEKYYDLLKRKGEYFNTFDQFYGEISSKKAK